MKTALERRIAARQTTVEAGGHTFTLRRPTEFEKIRHCNLPLLDYLCEFIDAANLTEADLFAGGTAELVEFDRALVRDWLYEQPDLWKPLSEALSALVAAHETRVEAELKNSTPG